MPLTAEQIRDALRNVQDPDLGRDLVALNMVKDIGINGDDVSIAVELTTPACPLKDRFRGEIEQAIRKQAGAVGAGVGTVTVEFTADVRKGGRPPAEQSDPLPNVRQIVAVGAGKGGVGKSTVAVNLAISLARHGARTGLLDGDIYGPSLTTMLGLDRVATPEPEGNMLKPFEVHGIKAMTIGKLVPTDRPLIWRGPMAHSAFKQLALQTEWGELDYLVVDLPPGTGDVPLTLAQTLQMTGAVVVCTPQKVAQDDARRAAIMFLQLGVPVLGIVENMSYFIGDDGKTYDLFGRGGAKALAEEMGLPYLGAVPIHMELRVNCDAGTPLRNWEVDPTLAEELDGIARNLAAQISIAATAGESARPTLSIS
jgi:ATP-binding protein involved in chromosome partitioning